MACNCGSKRVQKQYVYTDANGKTTTYATEIEAKAAVMRRGGRYVAK